MLIIAREASRQSFAARGVTMVTANIDAERKIERRAERRERKEGLCVPLLSLYS